VSDLVKRLRASVKMDAHNGDAVERSICGKQMLEAANRIEGLERENKRFRDVLEMDDGENPETLRQELMELAEVTIRIREENADLKRDCVKLHSELLCQTEYAVELDRVSSDLIRQLAEVYKSCISAMYSVVMGSASLDTRTAFESAEGAIRALIPKEATDE